LYKLNSKNNKSIITSLKLDTKQPHFPDTDLAMWTRYDGSITQIQFMQILIAEPGLVTIA